MAFREARIYFSVSPKEEEIRLNRELGNPFTFYMDAVMRGRFKAYSGPEVKGINIVNLFLSEKPLDQSEWLPMMNTYQKKVPFDYSTLIGSRSQRIETLIGIFQQEAAKSLLPQMQVLARHIEESKEKMSIENAICRGDEYLKALHKRVEERKCSEKMAEQGDAVNPHASGTFVTHPADAGSAPKASGDT